jgi:hypothetical protein
LTDAIKATSSGAELSFLESLKKMFAVQPLNVDPALLSETMDQWRAFWFVPAGMAAVIALIFFVAFWDKMSNYDKPQTAKQD